jgi:hypothetical protein
MWAFPKGKPQFFSPSLLALGGGMCCYSFGRRLPRWQQRVLATQPLVPLARRAFLTQVDSFEPVCGWEQWREWECWLRRREARVVKWVHLRSQWSKPRSSVLGLGRANEPHVFVTIEPQENAVLYPSKRTSAFTVPLLRDRAASDIWLLRSFDTVPRFHRTPRWDPHSLMTVADGASRLLEHELVRTDDVPPHWRPIHGDFVPWNLREDRSGVLWLLDWEDAGWGPPFADVVRYAAAYQSIHESDAERIAAVICEAFPTASTEVMAEAALFWTTHANLRRPDAAIRLSTGQMADFTRSRLEYDALTRIARSAASS